MIETLINEGDIPISNSNIEQLILASPSYSISLLYFQLNSSYRSYSISFTGTNNLIVNNPHYITDQRYYFCIQYEAAYSSITSYTA